MREIRNVLLVLLLLSVITGAARADITVKNNSGATIRVKVLGQRAVLTNGAMHRFATPSLHNLDVYVEDESGKTLTSGKFSSVRGKSTPLQLVRMKRDQETRFHITFWRR